MKTWFQVNNKGSDTEPAEILIYDQIGKDWLSNEGTNAKEFAAALKLIPKDRNLVVGINSPGGNVWDGLAIYNQLKARGDRVTTRIDGIAASIASVIAMAGQRITMPKNALMMIHKTWGVAMGNADVLAKLSDELEKHDAVVASIYSERTGIGEARIQDMMRDETWMDGAEAAKMGFADELTDEVALSASISSFDFKQFRHAPEAVQGIASALRVHNQHEKTMNNTPNAAGAPTATAEPPKIDVTPDLFAAQATKQKEMETKIAELQAKADKERELRIRARLGSVIGANEVDKWLPRAMADETVIDDLAEERRRPQSTPSHKLPQNVPIENHGHPFLEFKQEKNWRKRLEMLKQNYTEYLQGAITEDRRRGMVPMGVNTYSATLMTSLLADGVITDLQHFSAPLNAYTRQFTTDPMKPNATVVVKNVTAGPTIITVDTSTSTYESGNSTVAAISVTVAQIVSAFQMDNFDFQSGGRLADLASMAASQLSAGLNSVTTTLFTTTAYTTNAGITSAASAFGVSELKTLYGQLEKARQKYAILDGPYYAQILPSNRDDFGPTNSSAYGYAGIYELTDWSNASNNIVGMAINPQAVCVASGLPMEFPGVDPGTLSRTIFTLPDMQLSLALHTWFNNTTRTQWASYDVMFGAAVGDETAGAPIKSA